MKDSGSSDKVRRVVLSGGTALWNKVSVAHAMPFVFLKAGFP